MKKRYTVVYGDDTFILPYETKAHTPLQAVHHVRKMFTSVIRQCQLITVEVVPDIDEYTDTVHRPVLIRDPAIK